MSVDVSGVLAAYVPCGKEYAERDNLPDAGTIGSTGPSLGHYVTSNRDMSATSGIDPLHW